MPEIKTDMKVFACCGRCWFDYGLARPLLMGMKDAKNKPLDFCTFCDEERHAGGKHVRVSTIRDLQGKETESVFNIPHIIILKEVAA